jgi:hypothetical protein
MPAHMNFGQTYPLFQWVLRAVSQEAEKPGAWRWRLHLSNADIKVWSCTSTPPCACIVLAVFFVQVAGGMLEAVSDSSGFVQQVDWLVQWDRQTGCVFQTDVDAVCCSGWMLLYVTLWQVVWLLHPPLWQFVIHSLPVELSNLWTEKFQSCILT